MRQLTLVVLLIANSLPAHCSENVLATWDTGSISNAQYQAWVEHLDLYDTPELMAANLQRIVAILKLADADRTKRPELDYRDRIDLFKLDLALRSKFIWKQLYQRFDYPSDNAEAYLAQNPDAYHRPEQKRLYNIFLAFPANSSEAERQSTRQRLEGLRTQISDLESFQQLAREHSDSQSRWQGGNIGFVASGELPDTFDQSVLQLNVGQISEVLESANGVTLLYCSAIRPARTPDRQQQLALAQQSVIDQAWQVEKSRMEQQLLDSMPITRHQSHPDNALLSIGQTPFTQGEAAQLAQYPILAQTPDEVVANKLRKVRLDMAILKAAPDLDVSAEPEGLEQTKALRRVELRGLNELGGRIDETGFEPSDQDLLTHYRDKIGQYKTKAAYELKALVLPGDGRRDRVLALAQRLAGSIRLGTNTFSQIAKEYPAFNYASDGEQGPVTAHQLFWIDPDLVRALEMSEPGSVVVVETDSDGVWIMQLLKPLPRTPKPFEQVKSQVMTDWLGLQRRKAAQRLEAELVGQSSLSVNNSD